jgi:hypothetical protein
VGKSDLLQAPAGASADVGERGRGRRQDRHRPAACRAGLRVTAPASVDNHALKTGLRRRNERHPAALLDADKSRLSQP